MTASSGTTIQNELRCSQCDYALRTLSPEGRCPECGMAIPQTLLRALDQAALVSLRAPLNPTLRRGIRDGLILILLAVAGCVAYATIPESWFSLKTTLRTIVLAIACTLWVCSWFGGWKLGMADASGFLRDPISRRVLRLMTGFLLISPAMGTILFDYKHPLHVDSDNLKITWLIATVFALHCAGPLVFLRVNRLARRLRRHAVAGCAAFCACLWATQGLYVSAYAFERQYDQFNSLNFLCALPLLPAMNIDMFRLLDRLLRFRMDMERAFIYIALVVFALTTCTLILLLIAVVRSPSEEG
jgi:hypothetical protein